MSKQKTLKGSFSLCGKGLHTGLSLTVTFNPAPENTGYKIQRIDLEGEPVIQAVAENVVETQRGTVLGKGDIRVSTIEHGMSALYDMTGHLAEFLVLLNLPGRIFFAVLNGRLAALRFKQHPHFCQLLFVLTGRFIVMACVAACRNIWQSIKDIIEASSPEDE